MINVELFNGNLKKKRDKFFNIDCKRGSYLVLNLKSSNLCARTVIRHARESGRFPFAFVQGV